MDDGRQFRCLPSETIDELAVVDDHEAPLDGLERDVAPAFDHHAVGAAVGWSLFLGHVLGQTLVEPRREAWSVGCELGVGGLVTNRLDHRRPERIERVQV